MVSEAGIRQPFSAFIEDSFKLYPRSFFPVDGRVVFPSYFHLLGIAV